ncbi:MAG: glycosyltransferase, partial [Campylobacter concisus]|nr:glycosyltransferase [Campylobacter concisus]
LKMESLCREIFLYIFKFLRFKDIIFSKRMVRFFYIKDYEVLPNGIDVSRYSIDKKKNNRFTFISIGRLEEVKNHKDIIRIAYEMKGRFDFELQIVGDGILRCELQKLIDELELNDNVKLLGFRKDIPLLLNQAHCFLLPSLWEGMPIVLLEAAASCLPIISTPVGGIKDFLDDTNATLSSIANFKQEMIKMINNYDAYLVKANKLYLKVKNEYSIKAIVERHERIYLEAFQKTESITCAG